MALEGFAVCLFFFSVFSLRLANNKSYLRRLINRLGYYLAYD